MAFLIIGVIGEKFDSSEIIMLLWGVLGYCRFVDVVGSFTGTLVGFETWLCGGL